MSERLEKAKKILNHIKGYGVYDGNDDIEIFEWLIKQAERVEKLEKENKLLRFIAEENKIAYEQRVEQIKRYREALKNIYELAEYDEYDNTLEQIVSEIEKALEGEE